MKDKNIVCFERPFGNTEQQFLRHEFSCANVPPRLPLASAAPPLPLRGVKKRPWLSFKASMRALNFSKEIYPATPANNDGSAQNTHNLQHNRRRSVVQ